MRVIEQANVSARIPIVTYDKADLGCALVVIEMESGQSVFLATQLDTLGYLPQYVLQG
jgi:hypothetical protein